MNPQQLHDYIIKPTLEYMGGNYYSKDSAFLLLCTAAIESNCGEYIKQINGPALGIWQMEPDTEHDTWKNCDALNRGDTPKLIENLVIDSGSVHGSKIIHSKDLITSPMYACAMARLKYSMDPHPLPKLTGNKDIDSRRFYDYYKRVYNTELGASTYAKWVDALQDNNVWSVK